jgi:hypothetical protein
VNRHDPHLVAALVLLALDDRRFQFQRRDEGLQARQCRRFVVEREGQEFVEDIADLGAEPRQELPSPAMDAEHTGIEIMHGEILRLL